MIVYLTHWFSLTRPQPSYRLLIRSCSRRLFNRFARGGLVARSPLVVAGRVALALHSGRNTGHRPWGRHRLPSDGPAIAGALASFRGKRLARQRIASGAASEKKIRNYTIIEAFCDLRTLRLIVAYFLALTGALGTIYWIPTFVKRLSGFSNQTVTSLLVVPALIGIAGMLINGWHSDKTGEHHWHTAIPLVAAGIMFALLILVRHDVSLAILCLLLGSGFLYAYYPTFWAIPTMMLSESAAAATFGLINSIGQLGGFAGNYAIGFLNDRTHSLTSSFGFIALVYVTAGGLVLSLRIRDHLGALQRSNLVRKSSRAAK